MKKHEQWSDGKDKKKKSQTSANNAAVTYDNQAQKSPTRTLVVFLILLSFVCLTFTVITQVQIKSKQKVEHSLADKSFLAGDYKKAEAQYNALLTDLNGHHASDSGKVTNRNESFTLEKLALTQMAQNNFADAEKNLDSALDMHIRLIDHGPYVSIDSNENSITHSDSEVKDVLRVLNNKSQLYYLENKKELVPAMVNQTWDKLLEQRHIQRSKHTIFRILGHVQMHSLEKRHLDSEAAALKTQLAAIKALPKEERLDRYISILKEQRPPANAQFNNCDFGVFSLQ